MDSIPGSRISPGEGNGNLHQHLCQGNSMYRRTCHATVRGVACATEHTHTFTHEVSPYSCIAWYTAKDVKRSLCRFLELFLFVTPSFQVFCHTNISYLVFSDWYSFLQPSWIVRFSSHFFLKKIVGFTQCVSLFSGIAFICCLFSNS